MRFRARFRPTLLGYTPIVCLALCTDFAAAALEHLEDWSLGGKIVMEDVTETLDAKEFCYQLVLLRKHGNIQYGYIGELEIDKDKNFKFTPNPREKILNRIPVGQVVFAMSWRGSFARSGILSFTKEAAHLKDVSMRFSKAQTNSVVARVMDYESSKGCPGLEIQVSLAAETFGEPGLPGLILGKANTDANGILRVDNLPEGKLEITGGRGVGMDRLATPILDLVSPYVVLDSVTSTLAKEAKEDTMPKIYYIQERKGIYWSTLYSTKNYVNVPLPENTLLEFKAIKPRFESMGDKWNPDLVFQTKVGANSVIKTPVVPEGRYLVKALSGEPFEKEVEIVGMGSVSIVDKVELRKLLCKEKKEK